MTYKLNHVVWHSRYGDVVIPDQVVERIECPSPVRIGLANARLLGDRLA